MNASAAGIVRVATEPLLDVDSVVTVNMTAIASADGVLLDYRSARIVSESVQAVFDATISRLVKKTYSYVIPWEDRDSLGEVGGSGVADYRRVDSILFTTPLTAQQVVAKKAFPYITYIDTSSAMVEASFTNASQVAINFQDANYTLPASVLTITMNSSGDEPPELKFEPDTAYTYELALADPGGYDFGALPLRVESRNELSAGTHVQAQISAIALGNKVIMVRSVSIPS
jgi:hypothetical protein